MLACMQEDKWITFWHREHCSFGEPMKGSLSNPDHLQVTCVHTPPTSSTVLPAHPSPAAAAAAALATRVQVVQFFTNRSSIDPAALPYKLNSVLLLLLTPHSQPVCRWCNSSQTAAA
jgi:hypothetical protein